MSNTIEDTRQGINDRAAESATTHTPGPWQQHDPDYCPEEIWANLEGPLEDHKVHGTHICTLEDSKQLQANARLIAAAPDLLEALEGICMHADLIMHEQHPHLVPSKKAWDKARAAIAKARRAA